MTREAYKTLVFAGCYLRFAKRWRAANRTHYSQLFKQSDGTEKTGSMLYVSSSTGTSGFKFVYNNKCCRQF